MPFEIWEAGRPELFSLLALYAHLHTEEPPEQACATSAWVAMLADRFGFNHL